MTDEQDGRTFEPSVEEMLGYTDLIPVRLPELDRDGMKAVWYIKPPNALDTVNFASISDGPKKNRALFALIESCVVDSAGVRKFSTKESASRLREANITLFNRLGKAFEGIASDSMESGDRDDDEGNDELDDD